MEKKQTATAPKTHDTAGDAGADDSRTVPDAAAAHRTLFVNMALEMSWQLAVVVIVPIVGGYMLDGRLHTTPWLTLLGLAVAAAGVIGVLVRIVSVAGQRISDDAGSAKPKGKR